MAEVFLALGSNLGDRSGNLRRAQAALEPTLEILQRSAVHETAAQYVTDQPPFLNMVLRGATALSPRALLEHAKDVESALGRTPSRRFGPRVIDVDILFYGDQIINESGLQIPHPRIAERAFVLLPMAEIAPNHQHPVTGRTVAEMLHALDFR